MTERIRIEVSTCLLGGNVRYDGRHRHDRFITDTLGRYVEFVPVTLIQHYVRKYKEPYLAMQSYLNPHPLDLQLRNPV